MKRALLIVGGTLGGLGAVMVITPPQLNSSGNLAISGAGAIGVGVAATPTPAATKTIAPTPVQTPASKAVTGRFTGPAIFVNYGTVQVQLTVKDGRITDATALQAPTGRNSRYTDMALPILKKQTLSAQSANIQGASGASYTSYGWFTSLQGALAKAGL